MVKRKELIKNIKRWGVKKIVARGPKEEIIYYRDRKELLRYETDKKIRGVAHREKTPLSFLIDIKTKMSDMHLFYWKPKGWIAAKAKTEPEAFLDLIVANKKMIGLLEQINFALALSVGNAGPPFKKRGKE